MDDEDELEPDDQEEQEDEREEEEASEAGSSKRPLDRHHEGDDRAAKRTRTSKSPEGSEGSPTSSVLHLCTKAIADYQAYIAEADQCQGFCIKRLSFVCIYIAGRHWYRQAHTNATWVDIANALLRECAERTRCS